ncbi:hypothetical protein P3T76_001563 [Phytophthora citrophthora]|uniref:RxLR effector protein n=1 Tax=Phytophthora citrophthora TaxID=4793 RepID=A0AAD9H0K9_9STRA|nr:hypothetical protein P3T76_001563 [Phytophthora citrophthora]
MRLSCFLFAAAAALLASTNAASVSQTTPNIVAATDSIVKRSLRYTKDEEDPIDTKNEERGKGINVKKLNKLLLAKRIEIPANIENLSKEVRKNLAFRFKAQNLTKKKFATKLGMRDVDDMTNRNYPFYKEWQHLFLPGKKEKKVPEMLIGNHEYYF